MRKGQMGGEGDRAGIRFRAPTGLAVMRATHTQTRESIMPSWKAEVEQAEVQTKAALQAWLVCDRGRGVSSLARYERRGACRGALTPSRTPSGTSPPSHPSSFPSTTRPPSRPARAASRARRQSHPRPG